MSKLVFDIETIGEDFNALDEATQENLTRWIKREHPDEAGYNAALVDLKNGLGFSPLTGQIVAIGILDCEKDRGVVYFQAPGTDIAEFEDGLVLSEAEGKFKFKPMTEAEMIQAFWNGAKEYREFVSFNGRAFDVPFLNIRSAVHKIRPSIDLMSNRYLGSQKFGAMHVDLMDQLTYYGAVRKHPSLHLTCRAFGITSPKAMGVTGDDVSRLFAQKKFADIARYNTGDLTATKAVYEYWEKYLKF